MRSALKTRTLGKTGPGVSALGLGAMGMSDFYGPADRAESIATLKAALDEGTTLIDTGTSTARATTSSWWARPSAAVPGTRWSGASSSGGRVGRTARSGRDWGSKPPH